MANISNPIERIITFSLSLFLSVVFCHKYNGSHDDYLKCFLSVRCQTVYYGGKLFGFSHSPDWRGLSTTKHRGENWEANQPVHIQQLVKSWELWSWQFGNTPSLPLDQAVLQTNSCLSFPLEKQRELGLHLSKVLQLWYLLSQQLKLQERPGHLAKWSLCPWSRMPDAQLTPPPASPWKTNPLWNLFGSQKIPEYIPKHHL